MHTLFFIDHPHTPHALIVHDHHTKLCWYYICESDIERGVLSECIDNRISVRSPDGLWTEDEIVMMSILV